MGLVPTQGRTNLTEIWQREDGSAVSINKPEGLSPEDRAESIDWLRKQLGLDPNFPLAQGPH